jgi:pimeloyl-ACP methyl ester carboxylesterase
MTTTPPSNTTTSFVVPSRDGTSLAVWVDGEGPALVMVHGSIADHTTFASLVAVLRNRFTTFCMDRRGFGASAEEASPYTVERDFEDVAAVGVLVDILEMTDADIAALRADPLWPARLAAAHTVPRECHVEHGWVYQPGQFDGVTAPTLLLTGSDSTPDVAAATSAAAAAIPHARIRVLEGHAHFAHKTDPELVAGILHELTARPERETA